MPHHLRSHQSFDGPTPASLLDHDDPIDFIAAEHLHHRELCAAITRMSDAGQPDKALLPPLLVFLGTGFAIHVADEEQDLFPLMRQRCLPEDEIDTTLDRLQADHDHSGGRVPDVLAVIRQVASDPRPFSDAENAMLADLAAHERRHLIVENAIILPLARVRLTAEDKTGMRLRMLRRRGLDTKNGATDAGQ